MKFNIFNLKISITLSKIFNNNFYIGFKSMKKTIISLLSAAPVAAFACAPGTFGLGVQGSSTIENVKITVQAGNYNHTNIVGRHQYQEFCWDQRNGRATVTRIIGSNVSRYNWAVPDEGSYYKKIYVDENNWNG